MKINKKKITQKKIQELQVQRYTIKGITNEYLSKKARGVFKEGSGFYAKGPKQIASLIQKEWNYNADVVKTGNLKKIYELTKKALENSLLTKPQKTFLQNNFYKGLKNNGYLESIESALGEKIDPSRLDYNYIDGVKQSSTYTYTTREGKKWIITYLSENGNYDKVPVAISI